MEVDRPGFLMACAGPDALYAEEGDEAIGISNWDSAEACDRYRRSTSRRGARRQ
jgi:hypothetical protein